MPSDPNDKAAVEACDLVLADSDRAAGMVRATQIIHGRAVIVVADFVDGAVVVGSHVAAKGVPPVATVFHAIRKALNGHQALQRKWARDHIEERSADAR